MADGAIAGQEVTGRDELVAALEQGCKPETDWRIGTEHEKFGFHTKDLSPLAYGGPDGVRAMLEGMIHICNWNPVIEEGNLIALNCPLGGSITLEPGGQFELSGAPLATIHDTCEETNRHLSQVREVGDELGIGFLGIGFSPLWTLAETPKMPKGRYKIMSDIMPEKGGHGLDMMYRTATVQVNLDFSDEQDMVRKFRVSLALQPVATALFANSPFTEGRPNGFLSYRAGMWLDTDPDRTGALPFVFEDGMGFERYVDYALDVPMYFVARGGRYLPANGQTFRDFLEGRLAVLPDELPTLEDWETHLTTLFPDVRLKRFLEMRGADAGSWRSLCALPALWTGLLYDREALAEAEALVSDWSAAERQSMRDQVPKLALNARFRGEPLWKVAEQVVAIARGGLKRRRRLSQTDCADEQHFLNPLRRILDERQTPAERSLRAYHEEWNQDITRLFAHHTY